MKKGQSGIKLPADAGLTLRDHGRKDQIDLHSVLDGMSEGFALLDSNFTVLDINAETLRLESRQRDEIIGRSHWQLYPGTEDSALGKLYKKAMHDRIPVSLEHQHIWQDGRMSWLDMRAYPVCDDQLAVFFRDVTDRKTTEQKLKESEQRFKGAIEAFADALWTNDATGRMTGEQPGWATLTGQSYKEYQGYGWAKAVHPEDAQPTIDAWNKAVAEKRLFAFEHRVRRYDGVWRLFSIRAVPILNDDGTVREWVGVHSDITDLRESGTRLQQLVENIGAVFYVNEIDEGRISYISPAYERIWQCSEEALLANSFAFMDVIHPDDRARVEEAVARQGNNENTEIRYRILRPDGTMLHIHDRAFQAISPLDGGRRVVGIAEDVTAVTEARLQLAQAIERMEYAQAAGGIGIHDYDIVNDTINWDARVRAIWGVSLDEPISYVTFAAGVHPEDLPAVEAAVAKSCDPESDGIYAAEYRVINRIDGITRIIAATGRTNFEGGQAVRLTGTVRDVTAKRENEAALEEAKRFSESLIDTAPTLMYIFDLTEKRNVFIGPQVSTMLGYHPDQILAHGPELLSSLFHPDDLLRISEHHAILAKSSTDTPLEIEYRLRHNDGSWRWMISKDRVYQRDRDGAATQILGAALDVTERHRAQQQRELLIGELNHRVKNALAVVQSIAALTLRQNSEPAAWSQFEKRLLTMARAQTVLAQGAWETADVQDIADTALQAFAPADRTRVEITGPSARIDANDAMALSMVFHELATNAVKYGSLSADSGKLSIRWRCEANTIVLEWKEEGGPKVQPPGQKGFGSMLIESSLQSGGGARLFFEASGLRCEICMKKFGDH
jgi:PAS domain S-box-containing protein